jgi:hypothetical protein
MAVVWHRLRVLRHGRAKPPQGGDVVSRLCSRQPGLKRRASLKSPTFSASADSLNFRRAPGRLRKGFTGSTMYMIIKSVFDLAARGRGLPDDALRSGRAGKSKTNWTKPPGACRSMGIVWADARPRALRRAASAARSGLSQPAARWGKQRYATLGQGRGCLALRVAGDRGNGSPPPRRNEPV